MLLGMAQWGETGRMVQLLNVPAMARRRLTGPSPVLSCPA